LLKSISTAKEKNLCTIQNVRIGYTKTLHKKWCALLEFRDGDYIWKYKLTQRERERERERKREREE
jgi:hypothetical protein